MEMSGGSKGSLLTWKHKDSCILKASQLVTHGLPTISFKYLLFGLSILFLLAAEKS